MLALSVLMLPLWIDYFTAMRNVRIPWDYSLRSGLVLLLPIVAWLGRTRRRSVAVNSIEACSSIEWRGDLCAPRGSCP